MEKLGFALIVDEIFTRLPAKAIGCLKCVCKDFRKELSTHFFEMMHSCRIRNSHKKYLSLRDMSIVVDNVIGGNLDVFTSKHITFPGNVDPRFLRILASLNGLLLVSFKARCCELILWNPTTRCHKLLSVSDFSQRYVQSCDTGGMYFDETNDLKVLHIKYYLLNVITARVYSRRRETWREIDFLRRGNFGGRGYSMSSGIYSGKSIYFVCSRIWYPGPFERYIVAFNVISKTFRRIRFPESLEVTPWPGKFLSIAKKLHFIVVEGSPKLSVGLYKVEDEAFIKKFSINNIHIISYEQSFRWSNIFQNNKWLLRNVWIRPVEAKLSNEVFKYLQHLDSYIGAEQALFIETVVLPID
ncbi:putative F-box-like domain superfamily protein [Helianthus annuus]|nr:putative F-box-like domain superfamily protein [Helianthus annuus]KAJ0637160.1 putative F-box-like domain superfamily protein [Helianthus annuus]